MAAKTIKISDDGGANYYALPGNQGDFKDEAGVLDDTIFGQNFKSAQTNLTKWSVSANALYKGYAGYQVDVKKSGTGTTMTAEAMSLVSGKTYKTTNPVKNVWDRTGTFTVYDGGVDKTAFVLNIDFLFGQVTFLSSYTPTGAITVDGKYLPMTVLAKYRSFSLSMTEDAIDNTDIPSAQGNGGLRTYIYGLKTVTMELKGVYAVSNGYRAALVAGTELILEIDPSGTGKSIARGFFKPSNRSQSGNLGELEEETVSYNLTVPDNALMKTPFSWQHNTSDLSLAVQKLISAYLNETTIKVQYLSDGTTGLSGDCVVTDMSLAGGLEAMNEFSVNLQGTGAVASVP
jgi:predicted secreted protein